MTSSANTSASERDTVPSGRVLPYRLATPSPGHGSLVVTARGDGRSVVNRAYATSPLRLLTPANHGRAAWVYTSSYGGGLVDGDRLALDIEIGAGAAAYVSTQASTKVYRSRRGAATDVQARVGTGALLALVPDPVVCFADSRYAQTQRFDVAAGANLILVDWLSAGRIASGERWQFDEYVSTLRVEAGGTLVVHDALALRASDGDLATRLGRFDVLALALVLGDELRPMASAILERVNQSPVTRRADLIASAAPVGDGGCLLRIAARSVEHVSQVLREHLAGVPALLGDDPWARKW
jgi:urease accessory protein